MKTQAHDFLTITSSWLIPCRQKFYIDRQPNYSRERLVVNRKIKETASSTGFYTNTHIAFVIFLASGRFLSATKIGGFADALWRKRRRSFATRWLKNSGLRRYTPRGLQTTLAIPKIPPLFCFAKRRGLRDTFLAQAASPKIDIRCEKCQKQF